MSAKLKPVLIQMIRLKNRGLHDEARTVATKFLKEKRMTINSMAELKAHLPTDEIDFKGRPFLTEERLHADADVNDFFNRTRPSWQKVPHSNSYALRDNVTVR